MDGIVMEIPFSYEEAMRLYHVALQLEQDFYDFSPYYGYCSSSEERRDQVKEYVITSLRRKLLEAAGVSIEGREDLLVCRTWIKGKISMKYIQTLYRDPYEDEGFGIIEVMAEFMSEMGISEYEMRPSALFGYYLLNRYMDKDIGVTLSLLEKTLEEQTEGPYFYGLDYITYCVDYDHEEDKESEFVPPSIEEQRRAMLQFIQEYRKCLNGFPLEKSQFLCVVKKFLVYTGQYCMDDTTFLKKLPGLCVLLFGGSNVEFHMGKEVCMIGNAECDVYLIEDRELANIIKIFSNKEDVQVIIWCLNQMCDSGQRANSCYLQDLAGWQCTDEGIVYTTISCRNTDFAQNPRQGISIFSAFLAPLILDAVTEHVKLSFSYDGSKSIIDSRT